VRRLRRQELVADPLSRRPLRFLQTMVWDERADFERYWYSEEVRHAREQTIGFYDILLLPEWHTLLAAEIERPQDE